MSGLVVLYPETGPPPEGSIGCQIDEAPANGNIPNHPGVSDLMGKVRMSSRCHVLLSYPVGHDRPLTSIHLVEANNLYVPVEADGWIVARSVVDHTIKIVSIVC